MFEHFLVFSATLQGSRHRRKDWRASLSWSQLRCCECQQPRLTDPLLHQICEAFGANRYPFPEEPQRQRQMNAEVTARLRELHTTVEAGLPALMPPPFTMYPLKFLGLAWPAQSSCICLPISFKHFS